MKGLKDLSKGKDKGTLKKTKKGSEKKMRKRKLPLLTILMMFSLVLIISLIQTVLVKEENSNVDINHIEITKIDADELNKIPEGTELIREWWENGKHYKTVRVYSTGEIITIDPTNTTLGDYCGKTPSGNTDDTWTMYTDACAADWETRLASEDAQTEDVTATRNDITGVKTSHNWTVTDCGTVTSVKGCIIAQSGGNICVTNAGNRVYIGNDGGNENAGIGASWTTAGFTQICLTNSTTTWTCSDFDGTTPPAKLGSSCKINAATINFYQDFGYYEVTYQTSAVNDAPQWQDNYTSVASDSEYNLDRNYGFEVNWTDPDSGDEVSNVTFETNMTTSDGTLENITKANTTKYTTFTNTSVDIWQINFTQDQLKGAGNYVFRWYANDTSNAWNKTDQWYYTIEKNTSADIDLYVNDSQANKNVEQYEKVNFTLVLNIPTSGYVELWTNFSDDTDKNWTAGTANPGFENITNMTQPGNWTWTANYTNANYTTNLETWYVNVTEAAVPILAIMNISQPMVLSSANPRQTSASRIETQTITTSQLTPAVQGLLKTLSQTLDVTGVYENIKGSLRSLSQALSISNIVSRLADISRALSQTVSLSSVIERVGGISRILTQSLNVSNISARVASIIRSLTQSLNVNAVIVRISSVLRTLTQSLNVTNLTESLASAIRTITQSLNVTNIASRVASIFRTLTQSLSILSQVTRTAFRTYEKVVTAAMTITDSVTRSLDAVRSIVQSIASSLDVQRVLEWFRTLTQNLQMITQAEKISTEINNIVTTLAMTITDNVIRAASAVRSLTQSIATNLSVQGIFTNMINVLQSFNINNVVTRLSSILRSITGQITFTDTVGKFITLTKSITQSLTIDTAVERVLGFVRALSESFSINNVVARLGSIARLLSQSFNMTGMVTRVSSISRVLTQALSVVDNVTRIVAQIYQKIVSIYLSISQAIQRTRITSRAITQAINLDSITGRIASFYRSIIDMISFIFRLIFRFPAWFYSLESSCESAGYYWCTSVCRVYPCGVSYNKTYESVTADQILELNVTNTNTSISLVTNKTLGNIAFETTLHTETTPVSTTLTEDVSKKALKYFNITTNSTLNETVLKWVMLKFSYTEDEINSKEIVESTLSLYRYNSTLNIWIEVTSDRADVFGTGLNESENYVWANMTHMSEFGLGGLLVNGQSCSANAECYSNACCAGVCRDSCEVPSAPPGAPSVSIGVHEPPSEVDIKYMKIAVLREAAPGHTVLVGVNVKNTGNVSYLDLSVEVTGVPSSWISVSPRTLSLEPSESKGFNVLITPPPDAKPGDYKVDLKLKNGEIEAGNFFILRVKSIPPDYDKPIVSRFVTIDRESKKTNVDIVVSNQYREFDRIDVIESIPKDIATSTEFVNFKTLPTEIVRKDPIVLWSILGMEKGEEKTISYSVSKILDEFTQYVYWPLKQLNLVSASVPKNFRLVNFNMPRFYPGKTSTIYFIVQNPDTVPHNFTFSMEVPPSWRIEPSSIEETIEAGEERELHVQVSVPPEESAGKYMIRTVFGWDDNYIIKEYVADVLTFVEPMMVYILIAICLIGTSYTVLKTTKRRRFKHRKKIETKWKLVKKKLKVSLKR